MSTISFGLQGDTPYENGLRSRYIDQVLRNEYLADEQAEAEFIADEDRDELGLLEAAFDRGRVLPSDIYGLMEAAYDAGWRRVRAAWKEERHG